MNMHAHRTPYHHGPLLTHLTLPKNPALKLPRNLPRMDQCFFFFFFGKVKSGIRMPLNYLLENIKCTFKCRSSGTWNLSPGKWRTHHTPQVIVT